MWQAFESSIQAINRARRLNLSFRKRSNKRKATNIYFIYVLLYLLHIPY